MVFPDLRSEIMRLIVAGAISVMLVGCATTFIPISWGMREKVLRLSQQDEVLSILFQRYDPERTTLRVAGESFDRVDWQHDNWKYVGAYRKEHRLIYRNLEAVLGERDLCNIMVHELAHHIWFQFLTPVQKEEWCRHLYANPSKWQGLVRRLYKDEALHDTEDFAYTLEFPRRADIETLARLGIISEAEMQRWLKTHELPAEQAGAVLIKMAGPDSSPGTTREGGRSH